MTENKENKETFIDKVKRNWKNIALILLLLFSLSKCTSSCNKQREINKMEYQIVQMDSVITVNGIELDKLNMRLDDAKTSIDSYKGIATGNQKELVDKVSELTQENKNLQGKVNSLTKENANLKKEIDELKNEISASDNK